MTRLLIVGAGGHGRSVAEAVLEAGIYTLAGFVDDGAPALRQVGVPGPRDHRGTRGMPTACRGGDRWYREQHGA